MTAPMLFDRLRIALAAKGVSGAYTDRLIEELQLHFRAAINRHSLGGLSDENAQAAALKELGSEDEIVQSTLDTLRRESFVGRHRILSMIVLPPIIMFVINFSIFWLIFFLQ